MRRRADRTLHLELLRARAAAYRLELALAMRGMSESLAPLRSVADSVGSVTAALGRRGRVLKWLALAAGALLRARRLRRLAEAAIPGMQGRVARAVALAALAAGAFAVVAMRKGQSNGANEQKAQAPRAEAGEPEARTDGHVGASHAFVAEGGESGEG